MASIDRRTVNGQARYEVRYREPDGRDRSRTFTRRVDAEAFRVTVVANTIDPDSRTFRFLLPLDNQSRAVEAGGREQTLWRFRPGQRVFPRFEMHQNVHNPQSRGQQSGFHRPGHFVPLMHRHRRIDLDMNVHEQPESAFANTHFFNLADPIYFACDSADRRQRLR